MSNNQVAIKTDRLSKNFGELQAVKQVNLEIKEGEIFGLLGPNGAGKTTTIRMLTGMLRPTYGKANVIGFDTVEDSLKLRDEVGLLTETPSLYERLTVRHNLEFIAEIYGIPKEEINEIILNIVKSFELTEKLDQPAGTLSKGMKQKLAIARAMIHNPQVLFLDEPTAALAPESAKKVRDLILTLAKEKKRTFFIATHNLAEAEKLCDRVGIINKGELVKIGDPAELRNNMKGITSTTIRLFEWSEKIIDYGQEKSLNILNTDREQKEVTIKLDNPYEETVDILKDLINRDLKIVEINQNKPTLEKIYLELIEEKR